MARKRSEADSDKFDQLSGSIHVGVDVHKKTYHVATRGSGGEIVTWVCPAHPEGLMQRLEQIKDRIVQIVYEAGPTGFCLARALQVAGYPIMVVAPSRMPRPVTRHSKTDRLDCKRLAEYSSKGMLLPVTIPSQIEESERSIIRLRHQTMDNLRKTKQRIKSFLLFHGIEEPQGLTKWSKKAQQELLSLPLNLDLRFTLRFLVRELAHQEGFLKRITIQLERLAKTEKHDRTMENLQSIPGVGLLTAITFHLEVFRPSRFKSSEQLTSYLGLAPGVRQSGETSRGGSILPAGQKRLRSMLVEAAWTWQRRDPAIGKAYRRLLGQTGLAQKAIVALARKLAIVLWRLSIEQRPYRMAQVAG